MKTLYIITEIYTNNYSYITLSALSIQSLVCAIFVITSKNPIISVLFLIGLFLSIACYLILKGLVFIGISYLLVYVGAVSILFLFILMLINIRISELLSNSINSILLVFCISLVFITIMNPVIFSDNSTEYIRVSEIYKACVNSWESLPLDIGQVQSLGNVMYTGYSIYLILASLILLLAMVGAIVITIKQKSTNIDFVKDFNKKYEFLKLRK